MTTQSTPQIHPMAVADVRGRVVLVRCDLNLPLKDGVISDLTRLERVAPTIAALADRGAKVVVLSHFGRPKGRDLEASLRRMVAPLSQSLGRSVGFVGDCIGPEVKDAIAKLPTGGVLLLENLRFHEGEEANDPAFVDELAALGDIFVNDAFSAAHRSHASTVGLAERLPAYAGPLMLEELAALKIAVDHPERPVAAIVGGAKISSKIKVLEHMIAKVDLLIIGGAMANTFLLAQGYRMGKSLVEADQTTTALEIMEAAKIEGCTILLPVDVVVAASLAPNLSSRIADVDMIPERQMALDIGPVSVDNIVARLANCKTLLWNGPLGAFETPPFDEATDSLAKQVAAMVKSDRLVAVAGGGDTVAALNQAGVTRDFTYVSTAGGAFLEYLEGIELPGVAALRS